MSWSCSHWVYLRKILCIFKKKSNINQKYFNIYMTLTSNTKSYSNKQKGLVIKLKQYSACLNLMFLKCYSNLLWYEQLQLKRKKEEEEKQHSGTVFSTVASQQESPEFNSEYSNVCLFFMWLYIWLEETALHIILC